jgi:poly-gamma-glutamate synthesis protein (capsule biosynthesis protein)
LFCDQKEPILLSFVGDIMAHDVNYNRKPYSEIYEKVKHFFLSDDLTFGNLEFPISTAHSISNYPRFNVHPDYVEAAIMSGFDVFSCANNHSCDKGQKGVEKTVESMDMLRKTHGIHYSGLRRDFNKTGFEAETIFRKGWSLGFIAITGFLNLYEGADYVHLVNIAIEEERERFIEFLEQETKKHDLFIVSYHGGIEYRGSPDEKKFYFFEKMIEAGVDIVWGHHPHVLQPWFCRNGERSSVIISSGGNFISGQTWKLPPSGYNSSRAAAGDSAIFRVLISEDFRGETFYKVSPILITNYKNPEYGMVVFPYENIFLERNLDRDWKDYYTRRYNITRKTVFPYNNPNIIP